jgi:hypothetical protein
MGETFVMDELRVRVGDERVTQEQGQQQNRLERAVAEHGLNEEHFDTLLVRLNNVERATGPDEPCCRHFGHQQLPSILRSTDIHCGKGCQ